jgi:hypothetical protein
MRSAKERLVILAASTALATLLLAGCGSTPIPPPTPAPTTSAPVFASEDEALAAATEAYAAYQAMSDLVTGDGGQDPTRVQSLATSDYYPELLEGFASFALREMSSLGSSRYDTVSLVSSAEEPKGHAVVSVYLCSDVSEVRLLDASGVDVTPSTRPNRIALQVGFVSSSGDPRKLLIDGEDVWSGASFC